MSDEKTNVNDERTHPVPDELVEVWSCAMKDFEEAKRIAEEGGDAEYAGRLCARAEARVVLFWASIWVQYPDVDDSRWFYNPEMRSVLRGYYAGEVLGEVAEEPGETPESIIKRLVEDRMRSAGFETDPGMKVKVKMHIIPFDNGETH